VPGAATLDSDWTRVAGFCRAGLVHIVEREQHKGRRYRSLYSRTMFPGSHLLAVLYKLGHPEATWTAEFSDPQSHNIKGELRYSSPDVDQELLAELRSGFAVHGFAVPATDNMWELAEQLAYALADKIVFTNAHQLEFMLSYCPDPTLADRARAHAAVERHPTMPRAMYDAAPAEYELSPGLVHLGYFGVFYATRGLTEIISAIRSLPPEQRARLRLHVFTVKPDRLRDEAEEAGIGDVLVANPYLSFLEFLNLTTRLDVLLVNDYRTQGIHPLNPYLPAKYADYVGSGRAIWGIVEPGSMLSTCEMDYRSELGDVDGARGVFEQMIERMGQSAAAQALSPPAELRGRVPL
jgi:poly(ribitol-phosphate) beta-N-acetylglucosaminyltransferase